MTTLVVAPCSHAAARHAVLSWHYSRRMPVSKVVRFGAWEDDRFIGAVLFARGASPALGNAFGLDQIEVCELVRVALREHVSPVSEIVARALRGLKLQSPGVRLVVSFADPSHGHRGGIYQAGNWVYTGTSPASDEMLFHGKWIHNRDLRATGFGTIPIAARLSPEQQRALPRRRRPGKFRYVYPLDRKMRRQVTALALPYPRGQGLKGEPSTSHVEGPGSIPGDRSREDAGCSTLPTTSTTTLVRSGSASRRR